MVEESKYRRDKTKKHFNKDFVMTKKDDVDFKNSTKCWICDNVDDDGNIKVKGH